MKQEYAHQYGSFEQTHWWFRARRVILKGLLDHHIPWRPGMPVVEIGVGPGENLYSLYPDGIDLAGVEPEPENAARANARGPVPVHVGTVERMPAEISSRPPELICMFDVIEHIEDDEAALDRLGALLGAGGRLALSVPAFQWMWGQQDVVNMHYRRYTRAGLCALLERHGFTIVRATYFCSVLFPPIALFRVLARIFSRKDKPAHSDFDYSAGPAEQLLYGLFRMEWPLLKYVNLPFGSSCFVLAQKKA
jgi:SAM-dependent methyltransferase